MKLRELRIEDMPLILKWRNDCLPTLRTSFPLTLEQQKQWYHDEICNRSSRTRFWGIEAMEVEHDAVDTRVKMGLVGYGGIENIQWENSIGEISLLINPEEQGKGYGKWAARAIIENAFNLLGLFTVYAECYENNPAVSFWRNAFAPFDPVETILPNRKYTGGAYMDSIYLSASNTSV